MFVYLSIFFHNVKFDYVFYYYYFFFFFVIDDFLVFFRSYACSGQIHHQPAVRAARVPDARRPAAVAERYHCRDVAKARAARQRAEDSRPENDGIPVLRRATTEIFCVSISCVVALLLQDLIGF